MEDKWIDIAGKGQLPDTGELRFDAATVPDELLLHRGILSPDLTEYYYTVSDNKFSQFDIKVVKLVDGKWSDSVDAPFNSKYLDHGMSFSSDGKTVWFSSTRPVDEGEGAGNWKLWRVQRKGKEWGRAEYIPVEGLDKSLQSHPVVANSGRVYFHASRPDYSEMDLYSAELNGNRLLNAKLLKFDGTGSIGRCTPHISPDESYILFEEIGKENKMMIAYRDSSGKWGKAVELNSHVNVSCQGNPFVTADEKYLFFARGTAVSGWKIYWVKFNLISK